MENSATLLAGAKLFQFHCCQCHQDAGPKANVKEKRGIQLAAVTWNWGPDARQAGKNQGSKVRRKEV
jgi:hypothetical protein